MSGIRGVHEGKLWLYVYGRVITGHVDPIEKKPVSHWRPGSKIFSIATTGCNWLWSYDVDGGYQILPSVVTHVGERLDWIYRIRYGSRGGVALDLTSEHPIRTQRGWVLARNLRKGDQILKVWYQNTSSWKSNRAAAIARADFTCGVCGAVSTGLSEWNRHRGECYTTGLEISESERLARSERMRETNPMRDPEVARRALATSKSRFLEDPTHGWHRNIERLREWQD